MASGIYVDCHKKFLGTEYGGWMINPDGISPSTIVYSLGVGEDISFDLAMIDKFGCEIYAFDPTPRAIAYVKSQRLPDGFHLYEYAVAGYDGMVKFSPPKNAEHISHTILDRPETSNNAIDVKVHRLKTIVGILGHKKNRCSQDGY